MTHRSIFGALGAFAFVSLASLTIAGCSSSDDPSGSAGKGTAAFTTWGEDFIETEIPATVFVDGWSVKYAKYLVTFREITVADKSGAVAAKMPKGKVFDMTKKGIKSIITFPNIDAKNWDHVSYQVGPPSADADLGDGVVEADRALLVTNNASVHVEGTATKGAVAKTFEWDFGAGTLFDRCEGEKDGKKSEGVVITNGGTDEVQLTIHGDHLFYDDLQATNAKVRWEAISLADADADGKITLDELDKVKLVSIPAEQGGYGTGAADGINTLKDFVTALSHTIGHYRGEGECFAKPL